MNTMWKGEAPDSILIVKLSAIGDVVHSLPFLDALRRCFPSARIDWVVEEAAFEVVEGHAALDRVILCRRKSWERALRQRPWSLSLPSAVSAFLRELRSHCYDLVVDLQGLLKSGILVGLSRGKRKIGMTGSREGAGLFLNEPAVLVDYDRHAIDRYLQMAGYLGCSTAQWDGRIPFSRADTQSVQRILADAGFVKGPFVAINPIAGWRTKLWLPERFAILADRIRDSLGCGIVFTGSASDRPVIANICRSMDGPALNLAGKTTLKELSCLYARSRLLVTTDTGPMHVAAAMGCPVVALFGPTAPWRTGPYGRGHKVISSTTACSPCFQRSCDQKTCMKEIKVDHVFEGVIDLLERDHGQLRGGTNGLK